MKTTQACLPFRGYLSQQLSIATRRQYATGYSPTASAGASQEEIRSARAYCAEQLRKYDAPSYTLMAFIPPPAQTTYLAIRAFNVEIASIADNVSTPQIGALRLQFWRDNIDKTFRGHPPKQPVSILLAHALDGLATQSDGAGKLNKSWFSRIIAAREQYLNNNPYTSLEALEKYAENTYSTLLYLTLQALHINSMTADHVASHIGKAAGIATVLRGIPLLAFPGPPKSHSNSAPLSGMVQDQRQRAQQGVVTLPLDVMAEADLREEDVLRMGAEAPGLKDAVFKVATRASDHLITARTMVQNLRKGQDVGHAFEHGEEAEHDYESKGEERPSVQAQEIDRAFGVFMPAVSTSLWLSRLETLDFDIFREELRRREWKLPWKAYIAHRRKRF